MIVRATLKKPWRSHRGKVYPSGSTFELVRRDPERLMAIYDFNAPGVGYGWAFFPDSIFKQLTEEERRLRQERKKIIEQHIEESKDRLFS